MAQRDKHHAKKSFQSDGHNPSLSSLHLEDGVDITAGERARAERLLPALKERLRRELLAEGKDPDAAAAAEDDSFEGADNDVLETGCCATASFDVTHMFRSLIARHMQKLLADCRTQLSFV